jgi:hypothetical protein
MNQALYAHMNNKRKKKKRYMMVPEPQENLETGWKI